MIYALDATHILCSICKAELEHVRGEYRYIRSGFLADAYYVYEELVCNGACRSQMVYNHATPQERQMMRILAQMCELNGSIRKLAVQKREEKHGLPVYSYGPNESSTYGKHFDAGDLFDAYELLESIGENLAGNGNMDAPDWYTKAIESLGGGL